MLDNVNPGKRKVIKDNLYIHIYLIHKHIKYNVHIIIIHFILKRTFFFVFAFFT